MKSYHEVNILLYNKVQNIVIMYRLVYHYVH